MPFAIKIHGTNAIPARAWDDGDNWEAHPPQKTNWGWVCKGDWRAENRATFATQAEAKEVATACRWNNQTFTVTVVQGPVTSRLLGVVQSGQG